jgi:hypothetical protein
MDLYIYIHTHTLNIYIYDYLSIYPSKYTYQHIAKQAAAAQPAVRCQRRRAPATPSTPCIPPSRPSFRLVLSVSLPSFSVAGTARPERTAAYALPAPRACVRRVKLGAGLAVCSDARPCVRVL